MRPLGKAYRNSQSNCQLAGLSLLLLCLSIRVDGQTTSSKPANAVEWPAYGNDAGGMRFSPLTQINVGNVKQLTVAWTFRTGELEHYKGTSAEEKAAFEATPIMVDGTLFFSTPTSRVFAIDAATGQKKWEYNPDVYLRQDLSELTSRGVSVWPAPKDKSASTSATKRIFMATIDGRLIALDALSGKPISTFGKLGSVDLREGVGNISVTSPPAVIGNTIVVGSSMGDNQRFNYERGVVRAYDALTGALRWSWDPIPRSKGDAGFDTWKGASANQTGAANAWSIISADGERDLVFIPTTSPSPDYYGGERLGKNLYASSIVAIRASTGKVVWHFQTVHHDLWDYDNAAQPLLFPFTLNGKMVPAVAVGTKMGHLFILHRETGVPLLPVEERPMPASTVPGEAVFPTQPVPTTLPALGLQKAEAWGLTPTDKAIAQQRIDGLLYKGIFTPPSLQGSLMTPGNVGGVHWGGMSYDPESGLLITNVNRMAAVIRLVAREKLAESVKNDQDLLRAETGMQSGTPYVLKRSYLFTRDEKGIQMQTPPPWGTLVAINLKKQALEWEVPLGYMMDITKYPQAKQWGSLNFGGAITTAGGLVFVAASLDGHLRAFKTQDGSLQWEVPLPASGQATPMTYQVNGQQYVVIAAGGHGKLGTKLGDYVVAYRLP
ncbi:pyrroloquinoline quinone-dependent dehydrogenase [Spirosoma sp. KCTC 42546]|uniref:pyrroloquinoline quinone-dependent dehydrogenase n=1 Tax=Spirosoma sp. KCTC 42546 TaxID=2520506 RepID=UPI00115B8005|nr:pyrroloquinoline quinone-dependent dehydrogenase [Spirosoma sp. KCTC 42546]QDK79662.1 pyrroloquinoline quinone-dependent dehydrogenase [Spirosoma sp. KCTC 42546]